MRIERNEQRIFWLFGYRLHTCKLNSGPGPGHPNLMRIGKILCSFPFCLTEYAYWQQFPELAYHTESAIVNMESTHHFFPRVILLSLYSEPQPKKNLEGPTPQAPNPIN